MLDAAVRLLKRGGTASITTNRIAQVAGVSIGSVYQYFPNKRAIYAALHERHIRYVDAVMLRRIAKCEDASIEELVRSLLDGMVEAHSADPELSELLQTEVPHRADGTVEFAVRLYGAFRKALAPHSRDFGRRSDLSTRTFVMANMIESLGHAILRSRPRGLSLTRAKDEASRAILSYLAS